MPGISPRIYSVLSYHARLSAVQQRTQAKQWRVFSSKTTKKSTSQVRCSSWIWQAASRCTHPGCIFVGLPRLLSRGFRRVLPATKKKEAFRLPLRGNRQRPILPGRVQPSTFGTGELNCCVRYGNRWDLSVITTGRVSGAFYRILSFPLEKGRMTPP